MITVGSPSFSGRVHEQAIKESLFDLITGNVEGVRDSCGKNDANQTENQICAAVTQAQTKEVRSQISLIVPSSDELLHCTDVAAAQNLMPTLSKTRKDVAEGIPKINKWGTICFCRNRGKIYRAVSLIIVRRAHSLTYPLNIVSLL